MCIIKMTKSQNPDNMRQGTSWQCVCESLVEIRWEMSEELRTEKVVNAHPPADVPQSNNQDVSFGKPDSKSW
jgi:hypothetical protein